MPAGTDPKKARKTVTRRNARRWLVPTVAVASLAVPLTAGCLEEFLGEDDGPWWYGFPGCEECSDCYDEIVGEPDDGDSGAGVPGGLGGLRFEGEVPPGYELPAGGEERDAPRAHDESVPSDAAKAPGGFRGGSKLPDGVLRPRPDRPPVPDLPRREGSGVPLYPGKSPSQSK